MGLITITEANASLDPEVFTEWEALSDNAKTLHIERASNYVALNWDCYGVDSTIDWTDPATIPQSIKDVIARYANADSKGALYPDSVNDEGASESLKKQTLKLGPLEKTVEYTGASTSGKTGNQHLDDAMLVIGCAKTKRRGALTRV